VAVAGVVAPVALRFRQAKAVGVQAREHLRAGAGVGERITVEVAEEDHAAVARGTLDLVPVAGAVIGGEVRWCPEVEDLELEPRQPAVQPVGGGSFGVTGEWQQTADPRVAAALEAAKLPYRMDGGDFRLDFEVDAARVQRVSVACSTARLDQLEIRDVGSVASRGSGVPLAVLAQQMPKENARMLLGAWQVNQGPNQYLVVFSAPVNATADAVTLQDVIEVVVASTDRIEGFHHSIEVATARCIGA